MDGRGERIRTSGLYVPNVALYQAKLHPDFFRPALQAEAEILNPNQVRRSKSCEASWRMASVCVLAGRLSSACMARMASL